jgi:hypothetical protein
VAEATAAPVILVPPPVSVVVKPPFQVVHDGTVYGPNEIAHVPEGVAALWITCGWAVAK